MLFFKEMAIVGLFQEIRCKVFEWVHTNQDINSSSSFKREKGKNQYDLPLLLFQNGAF